MIEDELGLDSNEWAWCLCCKRRYPKSQCKTLPQAGSRVIAESGEASLNQTTKPNEKHPKYKRYEIYLISSAVVVLFSVLYAIVDAIVTNWHPITLAFGQVPSAIYPIFADWWNGFISSYYTLALFTFLMFIYLAAQEYTRKYFKNEYGSLYWTTNKTKKVAQAFIIFLFIFFISLLGILYCNITDSAGYSQYFWLILAFFSGIIVACSGLMDTVAW